VVETSSNRVEGPTGWVGWIVFAAVFLIILGVLGIIEGLAALIKDESYFVVNQDNLLTFNFTAWGWIHLIFGIILILVGAALLRGAAWARIVAVIFVSLNLIAQFSFLPAYPVWATIAIAIDIFILYALLVHGREAELV
jgi:hypothetical protein